MYQGWGVQDGLLVVMRWWGFEPPISRTCHIVHPGLLIFSMPKFDVWRPGQMVKLIRTPERKLGMVSNLFGVGLHWGLERGIFLFLLLMDDFQLWGALQICLHVCCVWDSIFLWNKFQGQALLMITFHIKLQWLWVAALWVVYCLSLIVSF